MDTNKKAPAQSASVLLFLSVINRLQGVLVVFPS
jgi:hypothetical protein